MFEKIKINNSKGKVRQIHLFGKPIFEYYKLDGEKSCRFIWNNNVPKDKTNEVLYLKLNKFDEGAKKCFEYWLQVANSMDAAVIILCDKEDITKRILRETKFQTSIVRFIKSQRAMFKKFVNKMQLDKWWYNAAYAHLTTFSHAIDNNIQNFWNIDADDTIFMVEPSKIAKYMLEIKQYAAKNEISLFSLDMHHSNSNSFHWSYGITYTRNPEEILEEFYKKDNLKKWKKYQKDNVLCRTPILNLDWFTTFIKSNKNLKIETFYIDNIYFLHFSNPLLSSTHSLSLFSDNKIIYPIFKDVYGINNIMISEVPIAKDDIKFDFNLSIEKSFDFYLKYFVELNHKLAIAKVIFKTSETRMPVGGGVIYNYNYKLAA